MPRYRIFLAVGIACVLVISTVLSPIWAHGRPGGGAAQSAPRPSMGHSVSRPSNPATAFRPATRPSAPSRPSFSNVSRPSGGQGASFQQRPSMGVSRSLAPTTRPVSRPAIAQKPSAPTDRPSFGNVDWPSASRPDIAGRPTPRPLAGNGGLGGRPGVGDRPGIADRPGVASRPGVGNGPAIGNRPGIGERPGIGSRPIIGGGGNFINRPGGDNNFVNINRPGWGLSGGYGHWSDHWYDHHVDYHHHGWYHGCWSGNWGNYWYAPFVAGTTAWGLSALLPSWGYSYGYTYANPYYNGAPAGYYNYEQPIAVNTYEAPAADARVADYQAAESPQTSEAYRLFDDALAAFKAGDYRKALQLDQQAISTSPHDPVMHEVAALCMFAVGDYRSAAAVLNNLLAVAPGMDWTTLSGLYGNVEPYTAKLRALESHCRQNPEDAAAHFVLAYHYLVAGYADAAAGQLKVVVAEQPQDAVAKRMLAALSPPSAEDTAEANQPPEGSAEPAGPTTDLVGSSRATTGTATRSNFRSTRTAALPGRPSLKANRRSRWPGTWLRRVIPFSCRARTRAPWSCR